MPEPSPRSPHQPPVSWALNSVSLRPELDFARTGRAEAEAATTAVAEADIDWQAKSAAVHSAILAKSAASPPPPARAPSTSSVCVRVRSLLARERVALGQRIPGNTAVSFAQFEYDALVADEVSGKVHVLSEARKFGRPTGKMAARVFKPDRVFGPGASSNAVFDAAVSPLVALALRGGSSTVLAYGATGSGKTHTMTAMQRLCAAALLSDEAAAGPSVRELRISFVELRGERCYDLLHEQRAELALRDDGTGETVVCGAHEAAAASVEAVGAVLAAGNAARATAPTNANDCSSRSHAICVLRVVVVGGGGERAKGGGQGGGGGGGEGGREGAEVEGGSLRLVDLAGSERKQTAITEDAERVEEMKAINASLGHLKDCIRLQLLKARHGDDSHVPYRRSKLTTVLKSCFVDAGATPSALCFLAHVAPPRSQGRQTLNTLEYAAQMVETSRADKERAGFSDVERWPAARVVAWCEALDGGRYAHFASCFARLSGKLLACEWELDVCKWVVAAGGTEEEGRAVFAAFQQMHREAKALQKKARPRVAAARRIVEPCVVGADFMGHMAESPGLEMERRGS